MSALRKVRPSSLGRQQGLSLIELLIATALGLVIVAALTQLFSDVSRTNREMAKASSQIENARFAIQYLRNDIVHAGYWGPFIPQFDDLMFADPPLDRPSAVVDVCDNSSWTARNLLGVPVDAYEAVPSSCASVLTDHLSGTDILVVRHAETCVAGATNCAAEMTGASAPLYFQASNCEAELDSGVFYSFGPLDPNTTEKDCTTRAAKRRFIQNIYYVRDHANTAGDGIPTLMRAEANVIGGVLSYTTEQLVQGIERFRVELGFDLENEDGTAVAYGQYLLAVDWEDDSNWTKALNRGDGVPDGTYVHCTTSTPCTAAQLMNTVAVKVYVLARADEGTPGYTDSKSYTLGALSVPAFGDSFKRHVFGTTVRINNVAGRRETP